MEDRAVHPRAVRLARAAIAAAVALATLAIPQAAEAHDSHKGGYRKWPWKAGQDRFLTTLPGQCPHCPGKQSSSSWKAIDANLNYETVYAISPGKVDIYEPNGGGAGKFLRIRDDDGSYITYEHLSKTLVSKKGTRVWAGRPIAVSGCTGNCSGPHLHFQRHDAPSFQSNALNLTRISGHGGSGDPLSRTWYLSDNGGIGTTAGDSGLASMRTSYDNAGGYDGWGVTSNLGAAWSPCRSQGAAGTWFRYGCAPRDGIAGSVQTYRDKAEKPRALMRQAGSSTTYRLRRGILAAYTEVYSGHDWVYWLGYPTSNRKKVDDDIFQQEFQYGYVWFDRANCMERMILSAWVVATYRFCD